jgi:hypothetical protein
LVDRRAIMVYHNYRRLLDNNPPSLEKKQRKTKNQMTIQHHQNHHGIALPDTEPTGLRVTTLRQRRREMEYEEKPEK